MLGQRQSTEVSSEVIQVVELSDRNLEVVIVTDHIRKGQTYL